MKKFLKPFLLLALFFITCDDNKPQVYSEGSDVVDTKNYLYSFMSKENRSQESSGWFLVVMGEYSNNTKYEKFVEFYVIGKNNQIYYVKLNFKKIRIVLTQETKPYCEIYTTKAYRSDSTWYDWRDYIEYVIVYINENQITNKSNELKL